MEKSDINKEFLSVTTRRELAKVLKTKFKNLAYNLYVLDEEQKYTKFSIKKRRGGVREIIAPCAGIKYIQTNLADILLNLYPTKSCVHGYVKCRNIKTNAALHKKKSLVVNIDLKDFFPSINFGRVQGLFKSYPFNFDNIIATTLAQICCYDGYLPQGAPTSPILSNYICRRLDSQLLELARKGKFTYSRYADDLTFSTTLKEMPKEIGYLDREELILSNELRQIIENNGFSINIDKTRYAFYNNRQEVTGLVVNSFPNVNRRFVRQVRAMLHAWEKFGVEDAAHEHFEKYNYKHKNPHKYNKIAAYQHQLVGKIAFVGQIRGKDNSIYQHLYERIKKLNPDVKLSIIGNYAKNALLPIVFCEGKTDSIHLNVALNNFKNKGKFSNLNINIERYEKGLEINNTELLKICEGLAKTKFHKVRIICLFDRDHSGINKKAVGANGRYFYWGNNVYSALLPVPMHRQFEEVCIEHYYVDEDLKRKDKDGRRLFLSTEFDKETGAHLTEKQLHFVNINYLKAKYPRIIDDKVFNYNNGSNFALPKNSFANLIESKDPNFNDVSFEYFESIFNLLLEIISHEPKKA